MSIALAAQDLAQHLRQGEAAIFPTDTLPALASRPEHAAQLWNLKERPQHKPLILMGACANDLWQWLGRKPLASWTQLADQYWPGALTLVVPAAPELVNPLHPGGSRRRPRFHPLFRPPSQPRPCGHFVFAPV